MKKFEYVRITCLEHRVEPICNKWGQEGWELVQVLGTMFNDCGITEVTLYFKREISS